MPIEFDCVCGAEIEALDGQAGRKVMCPRCRSDLTVPPRSTARRPEVVPDLGIDLAGPVRLAERHRPLVSSSRALAWSRAFWGTLGTVVAFLGLCVVGLVVEAVTDAPAPAERRPDPVAERYYRQREARLEREREEAAREEAARRERANRPGLDRLSPDRRLWATATPEDMALTWARRVRPGNYEVRSARKLMAMLVAILEDPETSQAYGLRMDGFDGADSAVLTLTAMRDH